MGESQRHASQSGFKVLANLGVALREAETALEELRAAADSLTVHILGS
jgi:hypothetical protein